MKNNYFFIYETTNLINNKKYRGIHKTTNINDGYIGSGTSFKNSVKKYGKENFKREILEHCNSYEELLEKEKFYVDKEWINNKSNYNIKTGGQSAGILSDESKKKISDTLKEKYKNGEIVATIGEWCKENGHLRKGIKMSEEFKEKCSKSGKKRYDEDGNHPLKLFPNRNGHNKGEVIGPMKKETKDKISKTLKERWLVQEHPSKGIEPWNKGKKNLQVAWNKGIEMKKIECPHCKKMIDKCNGKRWHFDNCKFKIPS